MSHYRNQNDINKNDSEDGDAGDAGDITGAIDKKKRDDRNKRIAKASDEIQSMIMSSKKRSAVREKVSRQ